MLSREECQMIKCGVMDPSQVGLSELYDCSTTYGPGVLSPCHDDCLQFGACEFPPSSLPLPLSGAPTTEALINYAARMTPGVKPAPIEPVLIGDVYNPVPDIIAGQVPLVSQFYCGGWWAELNNEIRMHPGCALVLLGIACLVVKGMKKGGRN